MGNEKMVDKEPDWFDREAVIRYIVDGTKPFAGTVTAATLPLLEGVGHEMPPAQVWSVVIPALVRQTGNQPGDRVSPSPR